jgi:hypothetical protein
MSTDIGVFLIVLVVLFGVYSLEKSIERIVKSSVEAIAVRLDDIRYLLRLLAKDRLEEQQSESNSLMEFFKNHKTE